jgi:phage shock protein A
LRREAAAASKEREQLTKANKALDGKLTDAQKANEKLKDQVTALSKKVRKAQWQIASACWGLMQPRCLRGGGDARRPAPASTPPVVGA